MSLKQFLWFIVGRLEFFHTVSHQKARARWAEIVTNKSEEYK